MNNKDIVVGENVCKTIGYNRTKKAIMEDILSNKQIVIHDKGNEYKTICKELGFQDK